jgi:glycosyltransferase involved in cell wall biosynthesis
LGGLLGFRIDIIRHFLSQGHEVSLVTPKAVSDWDKVGMHDVNGYTVHEVDMDANGTNLFHEFRLFRQYRKLFRRERPDIVFNYTIKPNVYSSIAASMCGCRVVCMMAGLGYIFDETGLKRRFLMSLYKYGLRRAEHVLVLNSMNLDKLIGEKVVKPSKLILLEGGEGVDLNYYSPRETDFTDGVTFLMVSRLLREKGYDEFVQAASIVSHSTSSARFEILGPSAYDSPMGVSREVFEEDMKKGVVKYLGVSNDIPSVVGRKNVVVVVPSWYNEGMNRSLMEACAMGKPIITTDNPGCREMVTEGVNGYVVPIKDAHALADAMKRFICLKEERKLDMARQSRKLAEDRFGVEKVIEVYDSILNGQI